MFVLKLLNEKEVKLLNNLLISDLTYFSFLASEIITRDCLSSLTFRSDIPADKYEGCRPAAKDVRLGHYVNHSIKEHDIHRWVECLYFDLRNNSTFIFTESILTKRHGAFVSWIIDVTTLLLAFRQS